MSILLKDVALYQNGEIHEHSNIVVDGKLIRNFPSIPEMRIITKSLMAKICLPYRDL